MNIFKRHYEKIILCVLLLFFILSMVYVLRIIEQTGEITEESLQIATRSPDYEPQDPKSQDFDIKNYWEARNVAWTESAPREGDPFFSDLTVPFQMARCPGIDAKPCLKIIPLYYFVEEKPCPFCGLQLKKPPERNEAEEEEILTLQLTQQEAEKFKLSVDDALLDPDGDGFSNVFEIRRAKTAPMNARSHSPLWYRLQLLEIRRVELPVKFMGINTNSSDDKSRWDIQLNTIDKRGRERTSFVSLGDTQRIGNRSYKLVDVKLVQKELESTTKEGTKQIRDDSILYLEEEEGTDKLQFQAGQKAYSSRPQAIMKDCGAKNVEYICDIGDQFRMGVRQTGQTNYRVKAIDYKEMLVTLENPSVLEGDSTLDPTGKPMIVTKDGMIPKEMQVIFEQSRANSEEQTD